MKKSLRYYFNNIEFCNMCGSADDTQKVMGKRLNKSQGKNPGNKIGISTTVIKCTNCSLIYSNPQPIPFDINDHYGVPPEEYWKESYFVVNENYFQNVITKLKGLIDFKPGMKSLDIGAGLGMAMLALEKSGFETYGFEPSPPFHERAISKIGISPDRLKLGMMEDMEYGDDTFDFITFGAVLEHLYDPSSAILKALKWLKPNGVIHIEVPSSDWLINKIINLFYSVTGSDYVGNISPMHEPFHLYEFGLKSFTEHSKKHNYHLAFHEYFVCETFLPQAFDFLLQPYMKWTNTGMQLSVWLKKR